MITGILTLAAFMAGFLFGALTVLSYTVDEEE
jgi:hypothetical protein